MKNLITITLLIILSSFKSVTDVHKKALVIDTHTDTPLQMIKHPFNMGVEHDAKYSKIDFPRLRKGGTDAVFFALYTSQRDRTPLNFELAYNTANQMLDSTISAINRNPEFAEFAKNASDASRISKKGKTGIYIGMENGFPLGKDITLVKEFYDKGIRYITLSHSRNNDICDSSTDPDGSEHNGLSQFGKEVLHEMNKLGMIIDVSHISDKAFFDVIELSTAPLIASHSSVRAICNHPRNMSDEMIRKLAERGGVIQICILGDYIREADTASVNFIKMKELRLKYNNFKYKDEADRKAAWAEWDSINLNFPPVLPSVSETVDHIDYVVRLVGVEHVGIGSDFDGGGGLADCFDCSGFPKITEELLKRGYSQNEINKIWGGNFLRVFKEVENCARNRKMI